MYVGTVRRQIMFSRVELKTKAKDALRVSYWKAFIVSLVLVMFTGEGGPTAKFTTIALVLIAVLIAFPFRIFFRISI